MRAYEHIFNDRHILKEPNVLKGPAHAQRGNLIRPPAGDFFTVKTHRSFFGGVDAGDHIEEGRFAGPVGADDAGNRATFQFEVNRVDGSEAPKTFRNFVQM